MRGSVNFTCIRRVTLLLLLPLLLPPPPPPRLSPANATDDASAFYFPEFSYRVFSSNVVIAVFIRLLFYMNWSRRDLFLPLIHPVSTCYTRQTGWRKIADHFPPAAHVLISLSYADRLLLIHLLLHSDCCLYGVRRFTVWNNLPSLTSHH